MSAIDETTLRRLKKRADGPAPVDMASPRVRQQRRLSRRDMRHAENDLGFTLPTGVCQLYTEVANGGFGPGYGIIGLHGGYLSDTGNDVLNEYKAFRTRNPGDPTYHWPDTVLPICHWGCGIYSCVDCADGQARILRFDPNLVNDDWSIAWGDECLTLKAWLQAWLNGVDLFAADTPQINPTRRDCKTFGSGSFPVVTECGGRR